MNVAILVMDVAGNQKYAVKVVKGSETAWIEGFLTGVKLFGFEDFNGSFQLIYGDIE